MKNLSIQLNGMNKGLIPCVTQQYLTNEILMMAWVNKESLKFNY